MNKENEQGFFNQIEEVLQSHEETYELGAWEEFDANRKKNKRRWPLYMWTAAAVVLLVASFALIEMTKRDEAKGDPIVVKDRINPANLKHDTTIYAKQSLKQVGELAMVPVQPQYKVNDKITSIIAEGTQVVSINPTTSKAENVVVAPAASSTPVAIEKDKVIALKQDKFAPVTAGAYDSLVNRNATLPTAEKSEKKLTYSLVVSPSMSNRKMNLGAGMELSYSLGKGISINSGLLYTSINAKSNGQSLVASNSSSQSASLSVSGIELPLGIQYQTSGGFYAAAGVSAVGLLNDKLEYSYLQENTITSTEFVSGTATEVYKVVSERKIERSLEPLNNYIGFFNFSAGKKQAIGKTNFNIGPFVKVPFSSVSSERIKLLQGGVKVSFDF